MNHRRPRSQQMKKCRRSSVSRAVQSPTNWAGFSVLIEQDQPIFRPIALRIVPFLPTCRIPAPGWWSHFSTISTKHSVPIVCCTPGYLPAAHHSVVFRQKPNLNFTLQKAVSYPQAGLETDRNGRIRAGFGCILSLAPDLHLAWRGLLPFSPS